MATGLDGIEKKLQEAIAAEVEKTKEEYIKDVCTSFEKEVRRLIGRVTLDLSNFYSVQRLENDTVITVRIIGEKR